MRTYVSFGWGMWGCEQPVLDDQSQPGVWLAESCCSIIGRSEELNLNPGCVYGLGLCVVLLR
jgi:hypothetical protein